jgi:hypothetical protein
MTHIIQSNPAVDYINGSNVYTSGDTIALPFETVRYGTMYHQFQVGTVAGHAAKDGKNVEAARKLQAKNDRLPTHGPHTGMGFWTMCVCYCRKAR